MFSLPSLVLFAKFVSGATLILSFDMSNTISPGFSSILSLIVSRFSSGYFSKDVLSVEYMLLTNHVPPVGIFVVFIVKVLLATSASRSEERRVGKEC